MRRTTGRLHCLTAREIQAAGDGDHTDGGGLLLRVRGDSASWVYRFTAPNGRRREMGLGVARRATTAQAGETVATARKMAHEAREQLAQGLDPIEQRDARREQAREAEQAQKATRARERWTLARCARDYHERVIEPTRTPKHAAQWIASLENHISPALWGAPIADVDAPTLLASLQRVRSLDDSAAKVPETLQRLRQRLDAVFEDAIFHGRCTANPAAAVRRKLREAQGKRERGQFAALPYVEAPGFMAALHQQEGLAARCLELALLTAARTGEVLGMEWGEVDRQAGVWTVPAGRMKAGEEHVVPLPARAVELLASIEAMGLHPRLVFPSPMVEDKPLSNMAMLAVLDRMGARERTTVHGLCRATFSTWANETAAARPDVIEACLAHEETNRVRAAYNRAAFTAERRALLEAWAEYLGKVPGSNVVPLRAA